MLLTWDVTSATGAKQYYASSVSPEAVLSRQGYYAEGQDTAGKYGGKLGERLGIAGDYVDKESFELLCDNLHPGEATPLTPRTNHFRRVCKDFTFSGPKSFSIIEAFASDDERRQLRQAFDDAVAETMEQDIEPDMQTRVRIGGADYNRTTGNVLTAGFDHATSRPEDENAIPDMHWHKHLLVWNATYDPVEERIKAGQLGNVVRDKGYYRSAFYSRLAGKLEGLGYAIDRRGGYEWEIAGVPQSAIDTFSKRTEQIDAEAERRGITDAASKGALGAKIRAKKAKDLTMPELRTAWDAQLSDGERDALARVYGREIAAARDVTPAEAVCYAIDHCSEKLSAIPVRELKRVALLHSLGSCTPQQIEAELPLQGIFADVIDGQLVGTTDRLQAEDREIAGFAADGRGSVQPVGIADGLDRQLEDGKSLNDGQWAAVQGLLTSTNLVNLVEGPAGAGKSSLLEKYDEGMRLAGEEVQYFATTTKAAEVLQEAGFKATKTVAHFLRDEKMQAAARGSTVNIDEVSMLGHRDAVTLFRIAEKYDLRLNFFGDPMQHGAVARGAFLRLLKDYGGIQPFRLTEILRQDDPQHRAAATLLSEGETLAGLDMLDAMGCVREMSDEDRRLHIAADYLQAQDDLHALPENRRVLVVVPTHAEAANITGIIRSELRHAGKLGPEDHDFTRLVAVDTSEAERSQATTYRAGDVIQFHQNCIGGFTKGDRLTVTDPAAVPVEHADKFSLYRPVKNTPLAAGDRIMFTGRVKTLDGNHILKNGMTKKVGEITPGGNIRLDNGWIVGKDAGHWNHAYCVTSFASQGKTVQRVIVDGSTSSRGAINQEQIYVSASRGKEWVRIYTDDKDELRSAVQRSSQKLTALDIRRPESKPELNPQPVLVPAPEMRKKRKRRHSYDQNQRWDGPQWHPMPPTPTMPPPYADRHRQAERSYGYER